MNMGGDLDLALGGPKAFCYRFQKCFGQNLPTTFIGKNISIFTVKISDDFF